MDVLKSLLLSLFYLIYSVTIIHFQSDTLLKEKESLGDISGACLAHLKVAIVLQDLKTSFKYVLPHFIQEQAGVYLSLSDITLKISSCLTLGSIFMHMVPPLYFYQN